MAEQAPAHALPDNLHRERAGVAAALAAVTSGGFEPPMPLDDHRAVLDGLLHGFAGTGAQPTLQGLA